MNTSSYQDSGTFLTGVNVEPQRHSPAEIALKEESTEFHGKDTDNVVLSSDRFEILTHIDKDKIPLIKDEFLKYKRPLTVFDFVIVMKGHLKGDEITLVSQLIELFNHIDIDGSKVLTWQDFTSFLVDQGMAEDAVRDFHVIMLTKSTVRDEMLHNSCIEKVYHFRSLDRIAFFEQHSKLLKMVSPDLKQMKNLESSHEILCLEYIEKHKILVVATSDLALTLYDMEGSSKIIRKFYTPTSHLVMCWSEVGSVLFTANYDGQIFHWDIARIKASTNDTKTDINRDAWLGFVSESIQRQTPKMRHCDETTQSQGRSNQFTPRKAKTPRAQKSSNSSSIVYALLELAILQQLASCGEDKNVMIWDVFTGKCKKILRGHEMGVRAMAFSTSTKALLSGGFDYNIFVWNPYVGTSIHTIRGHSAPIVAIEVLAQSRQAISADGEGTLKMWDLFCYVCLQTFVVDDCTNIRCIVSVPNRKRVVVCNRKLILYDYQHSGEGDQTDEHPILKVIYNDILKLFLTATEYHIRIWDAVTGGMKCVIQHKSKSEITDFVIDHRGGKVFIGDHDGEIWAYNTTTGCLIKKLSPHNGEVTGMVYCLKYRNLISSSWDRSIVVHEETSEVPHIWRRARNVHIGDITCLAYSSNLSLIATGSSDQIISIRDYGRLKLIVSLVGHEGDVSVIKFLDPFPLLVSADFQGNVLVWALAPHDNANQLLTRFTNMQSFEKPASVNAAGYYYQKFNNGEDRLHLFTGDEEGEVGMWDLTSMIKEVNMKPAPEVQTVEAHRKDDFDAKPMTLLLHKKMVGRNQVQRGVIQKPIIRSIRHWRGHQDSIRSVQVCYNPECVITAGYDRMVKIWNFHGDLISTLRVHPGSAKWKFPCKNVKSDIDQEQIREVLDWIRAQSHYGDVKAITT